MTDTNKGLAIVTNVRGAGIMRATEQPVTLGTAGAADPQRTTDFQAVLLAMAGHDLRQPLQIIQSSTNSSASASGRDPSKICSGRVKTQSIASVGSSINCWGLFDSMSILRR